MKTVCTEYCVNYPSLCKHYCELEWLHTLVISFSLGQESGFGFALPWFRVPQAYLEQSPLPGSCAYWPKSAPQGPWTKGHSSLLAVAYHMGSPNVVAYSIKASKEQVLLAKWKSQ